MFITKCDICRKTIKGEEKITAGIGYHRAEFCKPCGAPIERFLTTNRVFEKPIPKKNKK